MICIYIYIYIDDMNMSVEKIIIPKKIFLYKLLSNGRHDV